MNAHQVFNGAKHWRAPISYEYGPPAALGIPTLDGLGADGRGARALDEQISFSSLVPRAQLLVRLLETLR